MTFVDLIIPLALPQRYTYAVPNEFEDLVQPGIRVLVQFGKKKIYSSIIAAVHNNAPKQYEAKPLLEVIDQYPLLDQNQLKLINWMASYYMCTEGEILKSAIPAGLRLSSESNISLNPNAIIEVENIDERERIIVERLYQTDTLTFVDVEKLLGKKNIHKYIKSLLSREYIVLFEQISDKYVPKKVTRIKLNDKFHSEESLNDLFNTLEKFPKQSDWVMSFLQATNSDYTQSTEKSVLTKNHTLSTSSLKTLIKKGIMEEYKEIVSRFPMIASTEKEVVLSEHQEKAFGEILGNLEKQDITLLKGITGSGKTEIYLKCISEIINQGQQVLFLVPEIALTTQLVRRVREYFGDAVGVYHSKYSDNERVEIWEGTMEGRFKVLIGVRSSVFLPFHDLGLIVVDEEHESSYKQYEPNPRYNARDTAMMLAKSHHAKLLLGTATPAVETYFLGSNGSYGLVELNRRYGNATLPEIRLIDIQKATRTKSMSGLFSNELLNEIRGCISREEQVIVLQNRRGYAPMISCEMCNWTPSCINCEVSLTLHQYANELRCHYCGYRKTPPNHCTACGSAKMSSLGYGTEKIEEDLKLLIPEAKIERMDLETTRNKGSFERIINNFEHNQTNILVGTQMVSKGLDFDNVTLVCVLNADNMLQFPDFRATERAFQMLMQVSGRAGRKEKKGQVLIQTYDPTQRIFDYLLKQDYQGFYEYELKDRELLKYPPYFRLTNLTIKHRDVKVAAAFADKLAFNLRKKLPQKSVLGPATPFIGKIRNFYLFEILVKVERQVNTAAVKEFLRKQIDDTKFSKSEFRNVLVIADVDPA